MSCDIGPWVIYKRGYLFNFLYARFYVGRIFKRKRFILESNLRFLCRKNEKNCMVTGEKRDENK